MAKISGVIGYRISTETAPGVWKPSIIERPYYGDLLKNTRRLQSTDKVNDDVTISNEVSIVADPYANENFHSMLYIQFMGAKWKITNIEVQYPRLILSLGGLYNG